MAGKILKEELKKVFGKQNVFDDPATLEAYSKDESLIAPRNPFLVVKPGSADEVQKLLEISNETKTPIVPVSSGPPHFHGDTVPAFGGVVVDMSRMNSIRFIDRPDRVAMVEPGVRFTELQEALGKEGLRLPSPLCPRDTKSVMGSCLEREPHTIPRYHLDNSEPLLCAEVVFGSGDIFRTGEAAGPGTVEEKQQVGWRQKLRLEPQTELIRVVQGAQGTLGIMTWATVRCEVIPSLQKPYLACADSLAELIEFSYRLVRLRFCDELFILNAKDLAAILETKEDDINELAASLPPWLLLLNISGFRHFPEERVNIGTKKAKEIASLLNVTLAESLSGISANKVLEAVGKPSNGIYWKLREKGGCQDICFISSYDDVSKLVDIMQTFMSLHGFSSSDIGVYIQPVCQGHGYHCEYSIFYDSGDPLQRLRVRTAYVSLASILMDNGAFFSRPYDLLAEKVFNRDAATQSVLRKIKSVFDPNGIMNPGKLCF